MRVLIACEFSGIVREAFRRRGHFAYSCDLLSTEIPGPHFRMDVLKILDGGWDLMIAHPPCTYLTNAGVRHLHSIPSPRGNVTEIHGEIRWKALDAASEFFRLLLCAPVNRIAVENPIPHRYAVERIGRKYDQLIQPWMFGHGETKATCLWLKNLPPLMSTDLVQGREGLCHRTPPSKDRWKIRSKTYQGIAEAMAEQWGSL